MNKYLDLFLTFAKIGTFTFGGGYSMLPMIQREIVERKQWTTNEDIINYYAVGQCTPGVIAVNTATFVGSKTAGIPGGIIATLGIITPSIIIIMIIANILNLFLENAFVKKALSGVRTTVCALMIYSIWGMIKKSVKDISCFFLLTAAIASTLFFDISPVYISITGIIIGIINSLCRKEKIK